MLHFTVVVLPYSSGYLPRLFIIIPRPNRFVVTVLYPAAVTALLTLTFLSG